MSLVYFVFVFLIMCMICLMFFDVSKSSFASSTRIFIGSLRINFFVIFCIFIGYVVVNRSVW